MPTPGLDRHQLRVRAKAAVRRIDAIELADHRENDSRHPNWSSDQNRNSGAEGLELHGLGHDPPVTVAGGADVVVTGGAVMVWVVVVGVWEVLEVVLELGL